MTKDTFNVGIWGTGNHTRQHRAPGFLALHDQGIRIAAVGDIDLDAADRLAGALCDDAYCDRLRQTGYPVQPLAQSERPPIYASLETMLDDTELDGVAIVTPHRYHAQGALIAIAAGKHVLDEKPMAGDLLEAESMALAAERHGVVLTIGYQAALSARQTLAGPLGRAVIGNVIGGKGWWQREDGIPGDEHFWNDLLTTGVGRDLLPHLLAAWIAAQGEDSITGIQSATGSRDSGVAAWGEQFQGFDTFNVTFDLRAGGLLELQTSWSTTTPPDDHAGLWFYGDRDGRLELPMPVHKHSGYVPNVQGMRPITRSVTDGTLVGEPPLSFVELITEQNRNWVAACRNEQPLAFTVRQALAVERLVDEAQRRAVEQFIVNNC